MFQEKVFDFSAVLRGERRGTGKDPEQFPVAADDDAVTVIRTEFNDPVTAEKGFEKRDFQFGTAGFAGDPCDTADRFFSVIFDTAVDDFNFS